MQVTNLTGETFVLGGGVVLVPHASDVDVDDALYTTHSDFNAQIDSMIANNLISVTGKPSDPFAGGGGFGPGVTIQSQDAHRSVLNIEGAEGQLAGEFNIFDASGIYGIYMQGNGAMTLCLATDQSPLPDGGYGQGSFSIVYDGDGEGDFSAAVNVAASTPDGPTTTIYRRLQLLDLPTADPHVAGEVWVNDGVLTVSAG
jgi:hypothetical protein